MQRPSGPRQRPNGPQQGPAGLLIASLRSWRKEEARLGTITANQRRRLAIGLLLLTPILALQLQRRAHGIGERLQQSHDDTVAIMESGLAVSLRAARDWGHWDDAYRYMRGENPGYPVNNLGTAALFDGGAVMVLLERDGQARLAFTSPAFRNVSYGGLIRCLQANRQRLTRVSSTMRLACRIDDGSLYLGAATSVSNNDGSAPAAGTIGMFDPLLKPDYAPRILERMRTLRQELVLVAAGDRSARVITPPIHGDTDRLLALRRPPIAALLGRSLLEDLPVLLAIGAVATALRALQMLDRRARARAERLMERRANQRIRQACQALDQLVQPLDAGSALATTTPPPATSAAEGGSRTGTAALQPATERRLEHTTARLQAMVRHTRSLALHDALTGLPNRRHFLADLEERFRQAQGTEPALAILFIDVDRFKSINDLYGHAAGDTVLSLVSRRLRHLLGPCDLLARFGGDELAMILDLSDQSDRSPANLEPLAASMAARLTAVMGHSLPVADRRITVSLSIGYSLIRASDASIDDALRRSDEAMYAVKRQRRGLEG